MALGSSRIPAAANTRTTKRSKSGRKRRVMVSEGPTCRRNETSRICKDSPVKSSSPKLTANPANSNPQNASSKQAKVPEQPSKGSKEGIGSPKGSISPDSNLQSASSKQAKALEQRSEGSKEGIGSTKGSISSETPIPVNNTGAGKINLLNIDLNKFPPESPSPPSSPVKLPVFTVTATFERPRMTRRLLDKAPMDNALIAILENTDNAPMDNALIAVLGNSDNALKRIPDHKTSIPMWFSLDPERTPGVTPLPEITPNLKVEFEKCTVLHIKKYIAKKLNFTSERNGMFISQPMLKFKFSFFYLKTSPTLKFVSASSPNLCFVQIVFKVDVFFDGEVLNPDGKMCDLLKLWKEKLESLSIPKGASVTAKAPVPVLTYPLSVPPATQTPTTIVLALPCPSNRPRRRRCCLA